MGFKEILESLSSSFYGWIVLSVLFIVFGLGQMITGIIFLQSDAIKDTDIQPVLKSVPLAFSNLSNLPYDVSVLHVTVGVLSIALAAAGLYVGLKKMNDSDISTTIIIVICIATVIAFVIQIVAVGFSYESVTQLGGGTVRNEMQSLLNSNYSSIEFDSPDEISNSFNSLFFQYKCCGINSVTAQTTGFEKTAWCATPQTDCQTGTSKIPNICCVGITRDTLDSASSDCRASLDPGTFYAEGCYDAYVDQVRPLFIAMAVLGTLNLITQITVFILAILLACRGRHESNKNMPEMVALQ